MKAIFADTFYWVALTNKLDALHERALALPRSLGLPQIVTTEQVITEYLNFFPKWGEHFRRKASANVRGALATPSVTVVPHTQESFLAGLALYEAGLDKGYSSTDCISMETMRRGGLTDVLTNDQHFEREGFRAVFRL
ncbi:MAG: type II toxin-antitoxin system VapC family toxin [Bryobacteraceae bacterium]